MSFPNPLKRQRDSSVAAFGSRDSSWEGLFLIVMTVGIALAGVAAEIAMVWSAGISAVSADEIVAKFSYNPEYFYPLQARTRLGFEIACLTLPAWILFGYFLAAWARRAWNKTSLRVAVVFGLVNFLFFFCWCLAPAFRPNPADPYGPSWILSSFLKTRVVFGPIGLLVLNAFLILLFLFRQRHERRRNRTIAWGILLALWMVTIPLHFYMPADLSDDARITFHLNVLMHGLAQVSNGRHWLVDFPHMYGGYIEFLGPVLSWLPRRFESILWIMAPFSAGAMLLLLGSARLLIARPAVLLLTGLALFHMEAFSWVDHYYNYSAVRKFFPALGLFLALLYFRRPGPWKYAAVSLIASVATIWNLDTGLVLWGSWTVAAASSDLFARRWRGMARILATQLGTVVALWALFFLYLRIAGGRAPQWRELFVFQDLNLHYGFFGSPLIAPDFWSIFALIQIAGLALALIFKARGSSSWRIPGIVMISLMGIGLSSYYFGRALAPNLMESGYITILLLGFLLDEGIRLMAAGKLPRIAWGYLLPAIVILAWGALNFSFAARKIEPMDRAVFKAWRSGTSPISEEAGFVLAHTSPGEPTLIFSQHSGFYHYVSRTPAPVDAGGPLEWARSEDIDAVVGALNRHTAAKLLIDQDFGMFHFYRPEVDVRIAQAVADSYHAVAVSPSGKLTLYVPDVPGESRLQP